MTTKSSMDNPLVDPENQAYFAVDPIQSELIAKDCEAGENLVISRWCSADWQPADYGSRITGGHLKDESRVNKIDRNYFFCRATIRPHVTLFGEDFIG
jgi:hypothetical protein